MRHLRKQKIIAAVSSLALALTVTAPLAGGSFGFKASAAKTAGGGYLWNFGDGSIVAAGTKASQDQAPATADGLTVKAGYRFNDATHGIELTNYGSIEVKVDGPTMLNIGDCAYTAAKTVTVTSADGSFKATKEVKKGCYHNGHSIGVLYDGGATTLTIKFDNKAYVPAITADPLVPDNNGVPKDSVRVYNLCDGSIVPDTIDQVVDASASSKDGFLNVVSNGSVSYSGVQHGVKCSNGAAFEVKVAGDSYITFDLCKDSKDKGATITASGGKGEFVGKTTLSLDSGNIDGSSATFEYKGVASTLKFVVKTSEAEGTANIHNINVTNKPDETDPPKTAGNGKIDVWDFGAEQLDSSKYNNLMTVDMLNSYYDSSVKAGSTGVNFRSFSTGDIFWSAGAAKNNRLRTTNTAISRWDDKSKTLDDTTFSGYLYSNSPSTAGVFFGVKLYKGDILTLYMSSNGGASNIVCEAPDGSKQTGESNGGCVKLTFFAPEYGMYKIYSTNEKLVVCRALREHTNPVSVSGKVDISSAADIASKDYKIRFTNTTTGEIKDAAVKNGSYSVYLNDQYSYDVSLANANGYIIKDNKALTLTKGASATARDIVIEKVNTVTITGKITGLSADALSKLKLSFVNEKEAYVPEQTVSGDSITLYLESGVTYKVVAENVNDYSLASATISKTASGTQDIAFNAKPAYNINVKYSGLPADAQKSAVLTFTNINEAGYVYTFKAGETPKLRDGKYTVKVTGTGTAPYAQKLTSNVNVNGKAVDKTISFEALETWDFSKYNAGNPGIEKIGDNNYYLGLALSGAVAENKTYLLVNKDGEVKFDVKKGQLITLEYCYQAAFDINGDQVFSASGSTSKMETSSFIAPEDTQVVIKGIEGKTADGKSAKQTYFTKISVITPIPYKSQITVGANKEYKTINGALAAVEKMNRPNNERVSIVIDPGNYEEMLRINVPNVSLVNAAGSKSSLELKNKGVDIGSNVVRITSYYGHGYNYYSMGANSKWDAEVLAANKENGSFSNENPGAGKNNNSYWNSTVVVYADGFSADGIVFENSFNQYISKKESEDTVVMWEVGAPKGGARPAAYGDTSIQAMNFKERAGAMALVGNKAIFNNCKFVGRQDVLYGEQNIKANFTECDIYGSTDFIYGGMNAVFDRCKLRMNTNSADSSDQAYITAAQQASGRGFLFYNCTVTSTIPGVDTASEYRSKPGFFGRPWTSNTSEVVFFNTTIETTDAPGYEGKSLIMPAGWNNSLGGTSAKMYEYGTKELSGESNTASRISWSTKLDKPVLSDGTEISIDAFLEDWDPKNPATGTAGITAAVALAAIAGAAILAAKKRK